MNAALGAGLLNFPKAFDQAGGVLVAVLVQASLLVFIMIALYILATTSDIKQSTTLQEVNLCCMHFNELINTQPMLVCIPCYAK